MAIVPPVVVSDRAPVFADTGALALMVMPLAALNVTDPLAVTGSLTVMPPVVAVSVTPVVPFTVNEPFIDIAPDDVRFKRFTVDVVRSVADVPVGSVFEA